MDLSFLDSDRKNQLREELENQLLMVPEGGMIHIDKDYLEALIFYKLDGKKYEVIPGKYIDFPKVPIWTGSFLKKIDLSEVSFDNVCWNMAFYTQIIRKCCKEDSVEFISFQKENRGEFINLSYTNACIDFRKSFNYVFLSYYKDVRIPERCYPLRGTSCFVLKDNDFNDCFNLYSNPYYFLSRCSFLGLDLSRSNADCISLGIRDCDLGYSGAMLELRRIYSIENSNFEGLNLGDYALLFDCFDISIEEFNCRNYYEIQKGIQDDVDSYRNCCYEKKFKYDRQSIYLGHVLGKFIDEKKLLPSFRNTGLTFIRTKAAYEQARKAGKIFLTLGLNYDFSVFVENLEKGQFDGCYLDGKLIENNNIERRQEAYLLKMRADINKQIHEYQKTKK